MKRTKKITTLENACASKIHRKIIVFFNENQASIDTPRGVATWIDEDRARVKTALEDLVALNVLVAHRSTSTTGYSYTQDLKMMPKIDKALADTKTAS